MCDLSYQKRNIKHNARVPLEVNLVIAIPPMTPKQRSEYVSGLKRAIKGATVNPNGLEYKINVKCFKGHCKKVRDYMEAQGFVVTREQSPNGDHYGVKRFKTPEKAMDATDELYKKYNKSLDVPKIDDASMIPLIPIDPKLDL